MRFSDFLELCRDAEEFLTEIKGKNLQGIKLQGKKPRTLIATAIHYLARKRGINVTLHDLNVVYGIMPNTIMRTEKIMKELDEDAERL